MARKFGGSGLGHQISKKLVELMDGEIWVESEFEKGTSFYFTIQLDKFSGDEILPQKEEELKVRKLEKKKILLAEDNELNCLVFERFIKVLELNLEIVQNGKLAVDKVQAKKFDIIFMDINMPVMVGVEATLEIRKLNIPQPRIIALTADALEESKIKFLD